MTGFTRFGAIAVSAAVGLVSIAGAQSAPSAGSRPTVTSPYWDQPNRNGATTPAGVSTFDEPSKLVAQAVQAVPQAHADYVVAQWTYLKLNNDLTLASNHLKDDFRTSDEFSSATGEFNAAYAEFASARQDAIKGIQSSDDYRAAMDLRDSVSRQISSAAGNDPKKADTDRLMALAALKLEYVTPVRTVERELIAASPRVASARARLTKAAREVARLEKTFAKDVRDSIELADIRKNRESAKIAYLASFTYLQEARYARYLSLNYATHGRYLDSIAPRSGFDGLGYGGYGGGYGGGFGGGFGYGGGTIGIGYGGVGTPFRGVANVIGNGAGTGVGSNGYSAGFVNGGTGYSAGFVNGGTGYSAGPVNGGTGFSPGFN